MTGVHSKVIHLVASSSLDLFLKEKYYNVSALLAVAAVIYGCVFNTQSMALCVCVFVYVCVQGAGREKADSRRQCV